MFRELFSFSSGWAFKRALADKETPLSNPGTIRSLGKLDLPVDSDDIQVSFTASGNTDVITLRARIPGFRHVAIKAKGKWYFADATASGVLSSGTIPTDEVLGNTETFEIRGFEFKVVNDVCYVDTITITATRTRTGVPR